jgi:hypothetical protein
MSRKYRILFFSIFALFFVITTPFLVLYSLGYDLDLSQGELSNSTTITIDSRPRTANIYSQDKLLLRNSGELRANENQLVPLTVKQDGFLDENFLIWSGDTQNTTARIGNLWLLPKEPEVIDEATSVKFVSLLSKDLLVVQSGTDYYVQLYSFGGLQGNRERITSFNSIQNSQLVISDKSEWKSIHPNAYWDEGNEQLLVRRNDQWLLHDTRFFLANPTSLAYLNNSEMLLLDDKKNLWLWNYLTNNFRFLESGFEGLSYTNIPNYVWLWNYDKIYRISPNQISEQIQFEDFVFSSNEILVKYGEEQTAFFEVRNVYQGIFVQVADKLIYIPDYNKNDWYVVASEVRVADAFDNSIIWIDKLQQLWIFNLQLQSIENIATVPELANYEDDSIKLFYYFLWRRVVIYTPETVQVFWYDKDILNKSVVSYSQNNWIADKECYSELVDRYQFCLDDGRLIAYKNTSIW